MASKPIAIPTTERVRTRSSSGSGSEYDDEHKKRLMDEYMHVFRREIGKSSDGAAELLVSGHVPDHITFCKETNCIYVRYKLYGSRACLCKFFKV